MLPQSNAKLTAIAGGGLSEDEGGGYVAGADTLKWEGVADAYVHEEVLAMAGPTGLNEAKQTFIVVPGQLATVVPEDTVTFTYAGQSMTRIVRQVEAHRLPGHTRTTRLYLRET